jgi:hypothetical protein
MKEVTWYSGDSKVKGENILNFGRGMTRMNLLNKQTNSVAFSPHAKYTY